MANDKSKSPFDIAADELRVIASNTRDGDFLGSEDDLIVRLGVARVTVRQAARLLEREGLLKVRRGLNGGYFAARPKVEMVESIVCNYLETLGVNPRHSGLVATALWIQTLREAANADRAAADALVLRVSAEINALGPDTTIEQIGRIERGVRSEVFDLVDGGYIAVLFGINAAFARRQVRSRGALPGSIEPEGFFQKWRKSKLMELQAIADGDETAAILAGLHTRKLWLDLDVSLPDRHKT